MFFSHSGYISIEQVSGAVTQRRKGLPLPLGTGEIFWASTSFYPKKQSGMREAEEALHVGELVVEKTRPQCSLPTLKLP